MAERTAQKLGFIFIGLSIVLQVLAGVSAKYASQLASNIASISVNPFYMLSLGFLLLQAFVWQQALKRYSLTFAYPLMSLANFGILFASSLLFDEGITASNLVGLAVISAGVYLLSMRGAGT